jgi:hypothetical protein
VDELSEDDARHYSLANIDAFWYAGNPIVLPIAGDPQCTLDLHPANNTIKLCTPFTPPEPDLAKWRNISFQPIAGDGAELAELTVVVEDNVHGAYGLLTSIADQMQLEDEPLAAAVATAIAKHRSIFAGKAALSQDKEVGLFGELLVLEHLVHTVGASTAVESWQGPLNEEHDFVLRHVHVEVKTTSSEQRRHMMHGFMQLVPLRGVPLSLISIQLTRSNHEGGRTLSQLVSSLRLSAGGHRPKVDEALEAWGWRDEDAELYATCWTMRNTPRAYAVDEHFPALTLDRLARVVPDMGVVSDLSYRVDLTQFTHQILPGPLAGFVEAPEITQ